MAEADSGPLELEDRPERGSWGPLSLELSAGGRLIGAHAPAARAGPADSGQYTSSTGARKPLSRQREKGRGGEPSAPPLFLSKKELKSKPPQS